jgi:ABC-type sugar transport system ATPase subunit
MSIETQIAVRTVGLGKSFGSVHALRDVTLDLESGSRWPPGCRPSPQWSAG